MPGKYFRADSRQTALDGAGKILMGGSDFGGSDTASSASGAGAGAVLGPVRASDPNATVLLLSLSSCGGDDCAAAARRLRLLLFAFDLARLCCGVTEAYNNTVFVPR